ncbi:hypothetical protein GA0115240_17661, partial [Streptomyces sp. DvalAA-14]
RAAGRGGLGRPAAATPRTAGPHRPRVPRRAATTRSRRPPRGCGCPPVPDVPPAHSGAVPGEGAGAVHVVSDDTGLRHVAAPRGRRPRTTGHHPADYGPPPTAAPSWPAAQFPAPLRGTNDAHRAPQGARGTARTSPTRREPARRRLPRHHGSPRSSPRPYGARTTHTAPPQSGTRNGANNPHQAATRQQPASTRRRPARRAVPRAPTGHERPTPRPPKGRQERRGQAPPGGLRPAARKWCSARLLGRGVAGAAVLLCSALRCAGQVGQLRVRPSGGGPSGGSGRGGRRAGP